MTTQLPREVETALRGLDAAVAELRRVTMDDPASRYVAHTRALRSLIGDGRGSTCWVSFLRRERDLAARELRTVGVPAAELAAATGITSRRVRQLTTSRRRPPRVVN